MHSLAASSTERSRQHTYPAACSAAACRQQWRHKRAAAAPCPRASLAPPTQWRQGRHPTMPGNKTCSRGMGGDRQRQDRPRGCLGAAPLGSSLQPLELLARCTWCSTAVQSGLRLTSALGWSLAARCGRPALPAPPAGPASLLWAPPVRPAAVSHRAAGQQSCAAGCRSC